MFQADWLCPTIIAAWHCAAFVKWTEWTLAMAVPRWQMARSRTLRRDRYGAADTALTVTALGCFGARDNTAPPLRRSPSILLSVIIAVSLVTC